MKKSILFLIVWSIVFCSSKVSAQEQAIYNIEYVLYERGGCNDRGDVKVGLDFSNYSRSCEYQRDLFDLTIHVLDTFPAFANTSKFYKIITHNAYCFSEDGAYWYDSLYNDYTADIKDIYKTTSYWKKRYKLSDMQKNEEEHFTVTIWPKNLKIQNVSGPKDKDGLVLLKDTVTTISATPGFASDAYNWKYFADGWKDFPVEFQNKSNISFRGKDIFKTGFESRVDANKPLLVVVWAKDINGKSVPYGDTLLFNLKYSGPQIVSVTPQKAKCFEDTKTDVIVKFDKPLIANSKLEVANYKTTRNSADAFNITHLDASNEYRLIDVPTDQLYKFSINNYFKTTDEALSNRYYINTNPIPYSATDRPLKLESTLNVVGVYCYGGQDAFLKGQVKGGTSPYNLTYKNTSTNIVYPAHVLINANPDQQVTDGTPINNLSPGNYQLQVIDGNGCSNTVDVVLHQPAAPLIAIDKVNQEVSGYGLSNGSYTLTLKGGTAFSTNGYPLPKLKGSTGIAYSAQLISSSSEKSTYRFNNLPAGDYQLRALDANLQAYNAVIRDSSGCLFKESLTITQPPPLTVVVEQTQAIACYGKQTASLLVKARGGKRFESGSPYTYLWTYSSDGISAYGSVLGSDSMLRNRAAGFYKVLVRDKNNNNISQTYEVKQPQAIVYTVAVTNVTCLNWTDGALDVNTINGGTAPYRVSWSNGEQGQHLTNLSHGRYTLFITDANLCVATQDFQVKDTLNGIDIELKASQIPRCYGEASGSLSLKLKVASAPYRLVWNTGATDTVLSNLQAGTYTVTVLNSKNCRKEASFTLQDAVPLPLNLDSTRYLCLGQVAEYDLTVKDSAYTYRWIGPGLESNLPRVNVSEAGNYTATITDAKGCRISKTQQLYRVNESIASDFVVSSQVFAGDEVSLVNITQAPFADTSVWDFYQHPDITVKANTIEYATVVFNKAGNYPVSLKSQLGQCVRVQEKEIRVVEPTFGHQSYTGATSFIREFEVRPNPSNGQFEVMIRLQDIAAIKLRLLDFYSKSDLVEIEQHDQNEYLIPVSVNVAPGTYILLLETAYGTRISKVIIM